MVPQGSQKLPTWVARKRESAFDVLQVRETDKRWFGFCKEEIYIPWGGKDESGRCFTLCNYFEREAMGLLSRLEDDEVLSR